MSDEHLHGARVWGRHLPARRGVILAVNPEERTVLVRWACGQWTVERITDLERLHARFTVVPPPT